MTPLLLGHRGTPRLHRENTIEGFQAAMDAGLDGVELDVRRLSDGTLVVHHDDTLTDGRLLPFMTLDELPPEVPTLDQALEWAADTDAYVNVELKYEAARPDDRVPRSLDAVRAHGRSRRVIVSSFNPLLLLTARQAAPDIERGLLIHRAYRLGPLDAVPLAMRFTGSVALHPHHSLIDAALMIRAQRAGWRVNTWTVNEVVDVERLTRLGVDALIGDLPQVLLTAR